MPLPLDKIRVIDFSRILAGPYCTMMLGDLGADVLKIERPGAGDDTRQWGPPFAGSESAYYLSCNRNKRSVTLNLKTEEGRALAVRLARQADVVVENFLPGTMDRWGLGYEELSRSNPRLIYCSLTGFGQTGPRRDEPGYDIMIQALSGVMSITGEADGPPMKLGVAISDVTAGLLASQAILAALFSRERSGRGERIDLSLFDSTLSWLVNIGQNYLVSGEIPQRQGTAHPNIVPYQSFQAKDGSLIIAVGNDDQFRRFCDLISRIDLATDSRFSTNRARVEHRGALIPMITKIVAERTVAEWVAKLEDAGIPCGAVNTVDRALAEPQVAAREMVIDVPHPTLGDLKLIGSPVKLRNASPFPRRSPPRLGEHTIEVLKELLGLSDEELSRLSANGAI